MEQPTGAGEPPPQIELTLRLGVDALATACSQMEQAYLDRGEPESKVGWGGVEWGGREALPEGIPCLGVPCIGIPCLGSSKTQAGDAPLGNCAPGLLANRLRRSALAVLSVQLAALRQAKQVIASTAFKVTCADDLKVGAFCSAVCRAWFACRSAGVGRSAVRTNASAVDAVAPAVDLPPWCAPSERCFRATMPAGRAGHRPGHLLLDQRVLPHRWVLRGVVVLSVWVPASNNDGRLEDGGLTSPV